MTDSPKRSKRISKRAGSRGAGAPASIQRAIRFPSEIIGEVDAIAKSERRSATSIVIDALHHYLRDADAAAQATKQIESIAATIRAQQRETRRLRRDVQLLFASLDGLARLYLLHTPPVPGDALDGAAASASERYAKFHASLVEAVRGPGLVALAERLAEAD